MELWTRIYQHDKFLPYLGLFVVVTFALATAALAGTIAQAQQREDDRVTADLASCNRGNLLRGQVVLIGQADQEMVRGVLDVVLPEDRDERTRQIRAELAPILADHAEAVAEIQLVNCDELVPGAPTSSTRRGN